MPLVEGTGHSDRDRCLHLQHAARSEQGDPGHQQKKGSTSTAIAAALAVIRQKLVAPCSMEVPPSLTGDAHSGTPL